jgi:hypothetical protein
MLFGGGGAVSLEGKNVDLGCLRMKDLEDA